MKQMWRKRLCSGFETCFGPSTHHSGAYYPEHGSFLEERVIWKPYRANTGIGPDVFMMDSRRVLAPARKVPARTKTNLHTPKAVTHDKQYHITVGS